MAHTYCSPMVFVILVSTATRVVNTPARPDPDGASLSAGLARGVVYWTAMFG